MPRGTSVTTNGRRRILLDQLDSLVEVLDLVRSGAGHTRPDLAMLSGLGRTVITQRVTQLIECGLLAEGALGPSTGGRAPRQLRFRADAGNLLVAFLGATSVSVGLADLSGGLLAEYEELWDVATGPVRTLDRVEVLFDHLLAERAKDQVPIWGIGIGLPGPVEFVSGRPVAPPIMPGWDDWPVRERFASRYNVPVLVDNEVNTMALGELRAGRGKGVADFVYVKIGTGIGAGLISGGQPHRGAQGCAGDVGHVSIADDTTVVCRCGNFGCLEALAGGAALGRDGQLAAVEGRSSYLAEIVASGRTVSAADVSAAAQHGDAVSVELLSRCGRLVGEMLAKIVNFYNPSLILIGGGVAEAGDLLLATIRQTVYRRSLPLATRELRIDRSSLGDKAGLIGAAFMLIDELLSRKRIGLWIDDGSPAGHPHVTSAAQATTKMAS